MPADPATADGLDALCAIARAAGASIMTIYARGDRAGVREKADGSPVTEADAAAEAAILKALRETWPSIPVVAEEEAAAGRIPKTAARFFLVDPLDGTREFISRNGDFTVNIGLIESGAPVAGVVFAPAHGEIYAGGRGLGARMAHTDDAASGGALAWTPIAVRSPDPDGLVVVASRSHLSDETRTFIEAYPVKAFESAGSSLKFCRVAAGCADLYPRLGRTMEWDTAAGDAVLRAAGGSVRRMDGRPLDYGKRDQPDDADFANPWFVAAGGFDPFAS